MEKLDQVKEAIIAKVPEIKDLQFGCQVKAHPSSEDETIYTIVRKAGNLYEVVYTEEDCSQCTCTLHAATFGVNAGFQVLGRPITLADVLRAIDATGRLVGNSEAYAGETMGDDEVDILMLLGGWNLTVPLDDQSPETIAFLHSILCTPQNK